MMFGRRRTRKQLVISLLTGIGLVTILAIMVGTLEYQQLIIATLSMTVLGLIGIWFFDSRIEWAWRSDVSDYMTIVGLIGFWDAFIDSFLSWVIAIIFYWGLATLVRRARDARTSPNRS